MKDQMQDLARRAMACKHWRWMPGMLLDSPQFDRPVRYLLGMDHGDCFEHEWASRWNNGDGGKLPLGAYPVLSDPATLGCLVALLRKAWDSPMLNTVQERGIGWIVADSLCCSMLADDRYYRGQTEAEALVAALEAAP